MSERVYVRVLDEALCAVKGRFSAEGIGEYYIFCQMTHQIILVINTVMWSPTQDGHTSAPFTNII